MVLQGICYYCWLQPPHADDHVICRCSFFSGPAQWADLTLRLSLWRLCSSTLLRKLVQWTTPDWKRFAGTWSQGLLVTGFLACSQSLKWCLWIPSSSLSTLCQCGMTPPRKCSMWINTPRSRKTCHMISADITWHHVMHHIQKKPYVARIVLSLWVELGEIMQ